MYNNPEGIDDEANSVSGAVRYIPVKQFNSNGLRTVSVFKWETKRILNSIREWKKKKFIYKEREKEIEKKRYHHKDPPCTYSVATELVVVVGAVFGDEPL